MPQKMAPSTFSFLKNFLGRDEAFFMTSVYKGTKVEERTFPKRGVGYTAREPGDSRRQSQKDFLIFPDLFLGGEKCSLDTNGHGAVMGSANILQRHSLRQPALFFLLFFHRLTALLDPFDNQQPEYDRALW
jgi:hypothetical protein